MHKVSIIKTTNDCKADLTHALDLIGGIENFIGHSDVVMLKPNVNGTEAITNIDLVRALVELIQEYGVKKVIVAESTFGDSKMTQMFFEKSGYQAMCEEMGVELLNLNASKISEAKVLNPLLNDTLNIASDVFDVDKIINLPVMKVHYATGVSLAMKNLKGMLVGLQKRKFHDVGLNKSIVDLNTVIKPTLNIIDATKCMERMGPHGGDLVDLNLIIAGADIIAVDYVGCEIMGYTIDEVKHLKYYIEKEDLDLDAIEVVGERVCDVKRDFKKVDIENIIPQNFLINEKDACCTCMNALLLSFRFLDDMQKELDVEICMGEHIDILDEKKKYKIAFGNCRKNQTGCDGHIRGCPPYPYHLKNELEALIK